MLYRYLYPLARIYWHIFRPVTFGVRLILINNQQILLVRHTYLPDWMLPGGTVEYQEDFSTAIKRELHEELNISLKQVQLFGLYKSQIEGKRDHVIFFQSTDQVNQSQIKIDRREIIEYCFFPLTNLPENISPGHRRRINEYLNHQEPVCGPW